ncbi:Zona pellucida sperm-binding protein 4 [Dissostichus eleginoides]|uniref:Zona pellucida sperm-binding protein 4 n=1 Tax=Dissostichus eleginoides TaxID=100907 RepID=A0AAD9BQR3_DISEL|nr:Zona pellucida sperm-binding protein 4 [Dissostichus eleginoides]
MAKHWSFTCLVALALLGCSVRTQAQEKAQNSRWLDPSPRMGSLRIHNRKIHQNHGSLKIHNKIHHHGSLKIHNRKIHQNHGSLKIHNKIHHQGSLKIHNDKIHQNHGCFSMIKRRRLNHLHGHQSSLRILKCRRFNQLHGHQGSLRILKCRRFNQLHCHQGSLRILKCRRFNQLHATKVPSESSNAAGSTSSIATKVPSESSNAAGSTSSIATKVPSESSNAAGSTSSMATKVPSESSNAAGSTSSIATKVPSESSNAAGSTSSIATKVPSESSNAAENVRIPCGGSDISAAGCEGINCCFEGRQCYYGKAVTVQCTKDAQFIVVVAKDATLPNIDLESISLLGQGQGCTHVDSNSDFAIYNFPVTTCGSVVMEEPGVIIYENRMSSSFEVEVGDRGAITRDSYYELLFQCRYIGTSVETLVIEVLDIVTPPLSVAALGPISVHLRLANGECYTKGCNEVDVAYTSFYTDTDYPLTKVLRDPVYVEVQLLEKTDPNLVLTLGRCWTTTSPNPHSLPQWDILIDGCPYRDDRYLSELVPVGPSSGLQSPSHFRRFIFKMFTFVNPNSMEPLSEQVFIHCSTAVCTSGAGRSCEPSCFGKRRKVRAAEKSMAQSKVVVSVGPVIMGAPQQSTAQPQARESA